MDVKSIANSSNILRTYSIDTTQNNYTNSNLNNNAIEVKGAQDTYKNNNENTNRSSDNAYDKKDLDKAVNKLNKFLEDDNTRAEYSVHKDLGTVMIKIVDKNTDKVILELPPEKILNMVASMCKQVGLLDKRA